MGNPSQNQKDPVVLILAPNVSVFLQKRVDLHWANRFQEAILFNFLANKSHWTIVSANCEKL